MKNKNCPNCGAPYDVNLNNCPYCGTCYFDMSCIDFEECKSLYLKLKINMNGKPMYITQKVIPRMGDITMNTETTDICGRYGEIIKRVVSSKTMTTNISFDAICDNNGSLYIINTKE